jgi:formiminotetrahydrofolate cyclodeaminase
LANTPDNQLTQVTRAIAPYAAALAARTPTPGGGSAAAIVAVLSAALGEMVCQYTIGRQDAMEHEREIVESLDHLQLLRIRFLDSAVEDELAYGAYAAASSLPKGTESERLARREALERALLLSTNIPLEVAKSCVEALELLVPVAAHGNRNLISDAAVAALFAEAGLRAAVVNVNVNARIMKHEQGEALLMQAADLEQVGRELTLQILEMIDAR